MLRYYNVLTDIYTSTKPRIDPQTRMPSPRIFGDSLCVTAVPIVIKTVTEPHSQTEKKEFFLAEKKIYSDDFDEDNSGLFVNQRLTF